MVQENIRQGAARAAHEVIMAWRGATGQDITPWDQAPKWMHDSSLEMVDDVIKGLPQSATHDRWLANKKTAGWKWGPVRDDDRLIHPCMVPYEQLPPAEQAKDALIHRVIKAFLEAGASL